jgi:hypothetical protein
MNQASSRSNGSATAATSRERRPTKLRGARAPPWAGGVAGDDDDDRSPAIPVPAPGGR